MTAMNDPLLSPQQRSFIPPTGREQPFRRFFLRKEAGVLQVLVLAAATVATLALLVMASLTAFVVSLGLRARRTAYSRKRPIDA